MDVLAIEEFEVWEDVDMEGVAASASACPEARAEVEVEEDGTRVALGDSTKRWHEGYYQKVLHSAFELFKSPVRSARVRSPTQHGRSGPADSGGGMGHARSASFSAGAGGSQGLGPSVSGGVPSPMHGTGAGAMRPQRSLASSGLPPRPPSTSSSPFKQQPQLAGPSAVLAAAMHAYADLGVTSSRPPVMQPMQAPCPAHATFASQPFYSGTNIVHQPSIAPSARVAAAAAASPPSFQSVPLDSPRAAPAWAEAAAAAARDALISKAALGLSLGSPGPMREQQAPGSEKRRAKRGLFEDAAGKGEGC